MFFYPLLTDDIFSLMLSLVPDFIDFVMVYNIGDIFYKNFYTDFWGFYTVGLRK